MKSKPMTTTQPADLVEAVRADSAVRGETLSGYTGEALRRRLPAAVRATLAERPSEGRPRGAKAKQRNGGVK